MLLLVIQFHNDTKDDSHNIHYIYVAIVINNSSDINRHGPSVI